MISSGHYKVLLKLKEYHDICIGAESLRLWSYEVEIPKWTIETEKNIVKLTIQTLQICSQCKFSSS